MSWITPKTNWTNNDYFNVTPDYGRIKGNILYLKDRATELNRNYSISLGDYDRTSIPTIDFFNNIVESVKKLQNAYTYTSFKSIRNYTENGLIWNANDLNSIEKNIEIIYNLIIGEIENINKLEFMLGVDNLC